MNLHIQNYYFVRHTALEAMHATNFPRRVSDFICSPFSPFWEHLFRVISVKQLISCTLP